MARSREVSYARAVTNFVVDKDTVEISKQVLGRGRSAVFKATVKLPNGEKKDIAAKSLGVCITARNEAQALKKLTHPNIITYYGTLSVLEGLDNYILMEIAQRGDLYHHIKDVSKGPVRLTQRWKWILQSSWAVQYLHSKGLVHKDIKSSNFLIMDDFTLKLVDFGVANEHKETCPTRGNGTYNWMAREVLVRPKKRSKKSDVYSLGAVIWEMQTGEIPFKDLDTDNIVIGMYEKKLTLRIPSDCPPLINNVLQGCLEEDYTKRFTVDELLAIIPDDTIRAFGGCSRNEEAAEEEEGVPWCQCDRCNWMKSDVENQCCGNNSDQCMSLDEKLDELLDSVNGSTELKPDSCPNEYHSSLRRKTYRKFVAWKHGKKGRRNRVPIPSCVVLKIRKRYPDTNNFYVGFSPGFSPTGNEK